MLLQWGQSIHLFQARFNQWIRMPLVKKMKTFVTTAWLMANSFRLGTNCTIFWGYDQINNLWRKIILPSFSKGIEKAVGIANYFKKWQLILLEWIQTCSFDKSLNVRSLSRRGNIIKFNISIERSYWFIFFVNFNLNGDWPRTKFNINSNSSCPIIALVTRQRSKHGVYFRFG